MKELSIEEKAKAYDETIEKLRNFHRDYDIVSGLIDVKEELANLFPELRASEDERIRGAIIDHLKDYNLTEWAAWLEKQGEKKLAEKYNITGIKSKHAEGKLGEMIKEMKSTDKVEPKFHEGDLVILSLVGEKDKLVQVQKVEYFPSGQPRYVTANGKWFGDGANARLWTIQDARDGGILQLGKVTAIFKELIDDGVNCRCYCSVYDGEFEIPSQDGIDNSYGCHDATPATKEQRDTLMKAMTDAGYTFDFGKKVLKKIEQKPNDKVKPKFHKGDMIIHKELGGDYIHTPHKIIQVDVLDKKYRLEGGLVAHFGEQDDYELVEQKSTEWSEEDEKIYQSIMDDTVQENQLDDKQILWLKSLKERVQPQPRQEWKQENTGDLTDFENAMMHIGGSFFGQHAGLDPNDTNAIKEQANLLLELVPEKEWNEEDSVRLQRIIDFLWKNRKGDTDTIYQQEQDIDWLKSLRPRQWKPSDEQMEALRYVTNFDYGGYKAILVSLYEQLKKLREE